MHVNDWKRIAEQEARRYRDNRAFIQGVLDSGGDGSDRYRMKQKWVLAVDYVLAYLHRTDAVFYGWFMEPAARGLRVRNGTQVGGDLTFYAAWLIPLTAETDW